jgi:hypothetical protein
MPKGLLHFWASARQRRVVTYARYKKIMKPADAAAEYWATVDQVEAFKATQKRFDNAVEALKEYMVAEGKEMYLGIMLRETPGGRRLDQKAAIAGLGDKLDPFFGDAVRRSLIPAKRPKRFDPAAA